MTRKDKPLPQDLSTITESLIVQTSVSIGFPKRPRNTTQTTPSGHPSLESHTALPDGLYKGRMQLSKGMLPAIEWHGISVKVCFLPSFYLLENLLMGLHSQ